MAVRQERCAHRGRSTQRARGAAAESRRPARARSGWLLPARSSSSTSLFISGRVIYRPGDELLRHQPGRAGVAASPASATTAEGSATPTSGASLWHTLWFTILTTPPLIVLALVFALLADRVAGPVVLPAGVLRAVHPAVGGRRADLDLALHAGPRPDQRQLDQDRLHRDRTGWATRTGRCSSLAITTVWWTLGFNFVLYLAGLQEIPRELYEAAAIDGAGAVAADPADHDPAAGPDHDAGRRCCR